MGVILTKQQQILTPRWYPLKPHPVQLKLINSTARFRVVPAGRRCLSEGTLVATPTGPKAIETLKIGDEVIGYNKEGVPEITTVLKHWDNGIQDVVPLLSGKQEYLATTEDHKLWVCSESDFDKRRKHLCKGFNRLKVSDISPRHRVKKAYCADLISGGHKNVDNSYILGALIGDGCSRENKDTTGKLQRFLYISSDSYHIPKYIAESLNCSYSEPKYKNCTYKINYGKNAIEAVPMYKEWVSGKYAHEKIAPWEEIDQWNKKSALCFLAGVIDTDGSIYYKNKKQKEAVICIAMQSKSVVISCANIIFKYFQDELTIHEDSRDKYKNGSVFYIKTSSNQLLIRILKELDAYLIKKSGFITATLAIRNIRFDRIGLKKGIKRKTRTYDITVNNETNLYILHKGGIVTSNSGKTERAKRFLIREAIRSSYGKWPDPKFFAAAPTRDQAKSIFWKDLKALTPPRLMSRAPSESHLTIFLINGAEICVVGMDKPQRIEGTPWDGGILDEYANMKASAWGENVRPALSDRNAWCWMTGVPEGRNHYYDTTRKAQMDETGEWEVFTWPSADILSAKEIESAKRDLDPLTFQQEYEASFLNFQGRAYYGFDEKTHCEALFQNYNPNAELIFTFDFNVSPGTAAVIQEMKFACGSQGTGVIGEVHIPRNSTTVNVCKKLIEKWRGHKGIITCYGDSTGGNAGSAKVFGSDWALIEQILRPAFGARLRFDVPRANPFERVRVNAMNTRLQTSEGDIHLKVDPAQAPRVVKDFEGVIVLEGGSGELDKKSTPDLTHLTDGLGYYIQRRFPIEGNTLIQTKLKGL